jgi:hypothetical protein
MTVMTFDLQQELLNALLSIVVAVVTLSFGWLVGQRLTVYWAIRQKRRELELSAVNEFYKLYGEFFTVWKLWSYYLDSIKFALTLPDATRWELLQRASAAEGALESVFVKLSSERVLSAEDTEVLGKFRQAYQRLRESIRNNKHLDWSSQTDPEYLSFKRLAHLTACLILSDDQPRQETKNQTADSLEKITANVWENSWVLSDDDWGRLQGRSRKGISSKV